MPAKLTFRLEAREEGHAVPFDAFAEMTARIANVLGELDDATPGKPSVRWLVRDLRIGSAEVVLEAEPINPLLDTSRRIARQFSSGLQVVATQRVRPEWFTDSAWEDARAMVTILHDGVRRLEVSVGDEHVEWTQEVTLPPAEGEPIDQRPALGDQEVVSTVEGSLDAVIGHDQFTFWLWDALHRRRVICTADPGLEPAVKQGLFERVRVHGLVRFDRSGRPTRVRVESIQVLARGARRPTVDDLYGLAPNLTGGLPAHVWVRQIRDA